MLSVNLGLNSLQYKYGSTQVSFASQVANGMNDVAFYNTTAERNMGPKAENNQQSASTFTMAAQTASMGAKTSDDIMMSMSQQFEDTQLFVNETTKSSFEKALNPVKKKVQVIQPEKEKKLKFVALEEDEALDAKKNNPFSSGKNKEQDSGNFAQKDANAQKAQNAQNAKAAQERQKALESQAAQNNAGNFGQPKNHEPGKFGRPNNPAADGNFGGGGGGPKYRTIKTHEPSHGSKSRPSSGHTVHQAERKQLRHDLSTAKDNQRSHGTSHRFNGENNHRPHGQFGAHRGEGHRQGQFGTHRGEGHRQGQFGTHRSEGHRHGNGMDHDRSHGERNQLHRTERATQHRENHQHQEHKVRSESTHKSSKTSSGKSKSGNKTRGHGKTTSKSGNKTVSRPKNEHKPEVKHESRPKTEHKPEVKHESKPKEQKVENKKPSFWNRVKDFFRPESKQAPQKAEGKENNQENKGLIANIKNKIANLFKGDNQTDVQNPERSAMNNENNMAEARDASDIFKGAGNPENKSEFPMDNKMNPDKMPKNDNSAQKTNPTNNTSSNSSNKSSNSTESTKVVKVSDSSSGGTSGVRSSDSGSSIGNKTPQTSKIFNADTTKIFDTTFQADRQFDNDNDMQDDNIQAAKKNRDQQMKAVIKEIEEMKSGQSELMNNLSQINSDAALAFKNLQVFAEGKAMQAQNLFFTQSAEESLKSQKENREDDKKHKKNNLFGVESSNAMYSMNLATA